ncbi:MAG: alpha/beta hydrolase [Bacteroidota bacterium]|nr:alpha/beta hydrolase [Bacteroidota bacterium]
MNNLPLLLLHGALGDKSDFNSITTTLHAPTIHTLDFNSHGNSEVKENFGIDAFAEEVVDYLDQHEIEAVNIFGYSMGGYVALYLARYNPERIGKIMTLGTKWDWTEEYAEQQTAKMDLELMQKKVPAYLVELTNRHKATNIEELMERTVGMMNDLGEDNLLFDEVIRTIEAPILITAGDKDNTLTVKETILTSKTLPNGEYHIWENVKHPFNQAPIQDLGLKMNEWFGYSPN